MNALLISIAVATLGIDYGWQRLPEGGMQYIIQLNPQALEALRAGQPIESDIPAGAGEVRSYRIIVGKEQLPHELRRRAWRSRTRQPGHRRPGTRAARASFAGAGPGRQAVFRAAGDL